MMKKLLLILSACALLFCSCDPAKPDDNPGGGGGKEPADYTVSGVVSGSDGTLLSGVTVSDGYNCAVTGSDGRYYLNTNLVDRDYVFVSTPSGWSAPVSDGLAVFWKFLKECKRDSDGKYKEVDFTLNKISNPERFTMLIFADPQPRSKGAGWDNMAYHSLDCCEDMYRDMKDLVSTISGRPVYGMGLGDIVHRDFSLLPAYKKGLSNTGIACYNVIGNHDHDVKMPDDKTACKTYEAILGPSNYSFNLGKCHFVVLDDMIAPDQSTGRERDNCDTGLTEEIWQWLQNDLATVPFDRILMVCAHSPMFRLQGGGERSGARHYADYKNLFSKYSKVYAWAGHTHTTCNYVDKSNPVIETHTLTRVTGALWTNEFLGANGTPRGYVVFDYDNGDVRWKFKPTYWQTGAFTGSYGGGGKQPGYEWRDWEYVGGKAMLKSGGKELDDSYQMQIFAPGTYGDKYVYVNVFMWDEMWKTPVFTTDGVPTTMKRVTEKDNRYSLSDWDITAFYQQNNSYLSKEFSPSKNNCDSMFRAFVDSSHGSGSVSVTDRFGNTFTSTITW